MSITVVSDQSLIRKCASTITDKSLELIILPTEKCNFRCTYCYEDFSIGKMNYEVISSVKLLLEKRIEKLSLLKIAWFGGEPLVAKDVVLDISQYAMSLARKYNVRYLSNMITNGDLLDIVTANHLSEAGIRQYQISLDGPKEVHDRTRIRANGKGTFDAIWSNLIAIRNSSLPLKINLRLHFSPDNFQLLDSLIEDLKKEFISDSRFGFYFHSIEHLGGVNDAFIKSFSGAEKSEVIKILESKLFDDPLNSHQNVATPDDYVCYASKVNSLVIRANGNIGKCTVALSDERNNIGTLQPDGMLKLIPSRFAPWVRGIETLDPETLGCPLVGLPTSEDIVASLKEKKLVAQA
jgi:uncharacterized protein